MPAQYPQARLRRLRSSDALRTIVRETSLRAEHLVYPIFVEEETDDYTPIEGMPGQYRVPESKLGEEARRLSALGLRSIMPFGISHNKDETGSDALKEDGMVARMVRTIKEAAPELVVIPDICFCEYTSHGHCGILKGNTVDNDRTIKNLGIQAKGREDRPGAVGTHHAADQLDVAGGAEAGDKPYIQVGVFFGHIPPGKRRDPLRQAAPDQPLSSASLPAPCLAMVIAKRIAAFFRAAEMQLADQLGYCLLHPLFHWRGAQCRLRQNPDTTRVAGTGGQRLAVLKQRQVSNAHHVGPVMFLLEVLGFIHDVVGVFIDADHRVVDDLDVPALVACDLARQPPCQAVSHPFDNARRQFRGR